MVRPDVEIDDHCDYLEQTLIPDLMEEGFTRTADDFVTCVEIIRQLKGQRDNAIQRLTSASE